MTVSRWTMPGSMMRLAAAGAVAFAAVSAFAAVGQAEPPSAAASPPPTVEPAADDAGDTPISAPIMLETARPPPEGWPPVPAPKEVEAAVVELGPPERANAQAAAVSGTAGADASTASPELAATRPGRLVLYRTQASTGWRTPLVSVDDVPLFRPKLNTYTDVALPPGLYRVRVDWSWDTGRPDQVFDIRIAPGRSDYVRLTYSYRPTGPNLFELGSFAEWVAPEAAEAELRACCRRVRNEREPVRRVKPATIEAIPRPMR